ncbi:uncharacterized protein PFL1_00167 [Pseudozyma flocculosa PF-1]|uniref:1-alkyl-2-acetylglycerophosphocholine esterase n=1 Tax=Pseudozyma flocculosa TaxID=84751 RepID=A0A5C3EVJ6_9BASI|nr:uncharacterized protein PFL1_00167 [Pseudozyma flocculosa PF-1]EPQ31969.1 hypothetical protein PFL1_00167 [Pseudozyma flocculosa PF-1]SPO35111.1 related to acetylhydrolase [Pseudozyma flocculosa]
MGLPPYSGPFQVGVIDLEIPVRQPRSFCDNVVKPDELNRPTRRAKREAKRAQDQATKAKGADPTAAHQHSTSQGSSPAQSSGHNAAATEENIGLDEGDGEGGVPTWSPFTSGSKTSTLHLETVLFAVYYPCKPLAKAEARRYTQVAWLGRPKHTGVGALFKYLGQYGPFAIPASPAVFTLLRAKMPALAGPPLADPDKLRKRAKPSSSQQQQDQQQGRQGQRQKGDRATAGNFGQLPPQLPVVIFSHGLAGNRLSYSQFCGELASYGLVVVALEHRDGSGVSSIVRGEEAPSKSQRTDSLGGGGGGDEKGKARPSHPKAQVPYFSFEKIGLNSFSDSPTDDEVNLRRDQIEMRHAEIEECLYVLDQINQGHGPEIVRRSTRKLCTKLAGRGVDGTSEQLPSDSILKQAEPLSDWKGKLDLQLPTLCGHSFGGATVLEMMRCEDKCRPFPLAIVLDPWVAPVRDPDEDHEARGKMKKPVYVLNSESFTIWEDHFAKLKRICLDGRRANANARGWLMTLCGSKHTDFSDYPFLLPRVFRSTVGPRKTIEVFVKATYVQMGLMRQRLREEEDRPGVKVYGDEAMRDESGSVDGGEQEAGGVEAMQNGGREQQHAESSGRALGYGGNPPQADEQPADPASPRPIAQHSDDASPARSAASDADERRTAKERGFITDGRMVQLIDADRDAEEVHAQLERITAEWNYERARPKSLMSLFMLYYGFQPGLEKPGRVLIHQV